MTSLRVRCTGCEKVLKAPESARGKKVKCTCGHAFRIAANKASPRKRPGPPPRPQPDDVVEDFEEVDGFDEIGADDFDEDDEFADCESRGPALPQRRGRKPAGGRPRRRAQEKSSSLWDFFSGKKAIQNALDEHEADTGERYDLIKAGMPPLRLWLNNRKGDRWGLVEDGSGTQLWVRYRVRLFSNSPTLSFFE